MENPVVGIILICLAIILGFVAIKIVLATLFGLFHLLLPILIVGGLIYVIVKVSQKSLGGGRRTLP